MRNLLRSILRAAGHAFTQCGAQAQAVAFNMFLAFFPMLLLALSVLGSAAGLRSTTRELVAGFRGVLPPGSERLVTDFLAGQTSHHWNWTFFGVIGTLLAGAQVMKALLDGFAVAHCDAGRLGFWRREARGLLLLCATLFPWLAAVVLTVFGKQARGWLLRHLGFEGILRAVWTVLFSAAALALAVLVLAVVYRVGRPAARSWKDVLPGAVVATLLWWAVNAAFGFYVRHVKFGLVYGGLAAAIGLLLWMQLTALIVFLGAAYNAERQARQAVAAGVE